MTQVVKMPLTRALSMTKTLKKELDNYFREQRNMFGIKIGTSGERTNIAGVNVEGLSKLIKSDVDKIKHKLKAYTELKQKILKANSVTSVEINGVVMTIQDAIVLKATLGERKEVLKNLKHHQNVVINNVSKEQKVFEDRVEAIIAASTDKTSSADQIFEIRTRVRAEQEALCGLSVFDPCGVGDYIQELEKEINAIELDLDTALSIVNSNTLIEVEI